MPQDSTGQEIHIGDCVRWRGKVYTIRSFQPGRGRFGTDAIEFTEPRHAAEVPDEISVDLVEEV